MRKRAPSSWDSVEWEVPVLVLVSGVAGGLILSIFYFILFQNWEAEFQGGFVLYCGVLVILIAALSAAYYVIRRLSSSIRKTLEVEKDKP